jgi:hypothetical protein
MKACCGVGVFFTIPPFGLKLVLFDYDDELQRSSFICLGIRTFTGTQGEGKGRKQAPFYYFLLLIFHFIMASTTVVYCGPKNKKIWFESSSS